jgi:hypothetical protein
VSSDEATLLFIPAYKINELIDSNLALAQHLFTKAAMMMEAAIMRVVQHMRDGSTPLCAPQMVKS